MATRPAPSAAILSISLELAAVGVFTLLAGASDQAGTAVVIIMVGLWLLYLIMESQVLYDLSGALRSLVAYPSNNAVYTGGALTGLTEYFGPGQSMKLPAP
jgi:hypothetical protein